MFTSGNSYVGACFKSFFANCCRCSWCRNVVFCWRGLLYRDEFLLENFYEEISSHEWSMLEKEASKVKGEAAEKIVLVETNVLPSFPEHVTAASEQEIPRPSRSLVDYRASDFIKDDEIEEKTLKKRLNTTNFRSYTEPDLIAEMWENPGKTKAKMSSLKGIFQKRKYSRFTNEQEETNEEEFSEDKLPRVESKVKMRTKILTRRSQRPSLEQETDNFSRSLSPTALFNDYHGQIETRISFAAHVRRQGPGFLASCTQTLHTSDFGGSFGDLFESEVQSNVTFNPLFEDEDGDGEDDVYVKPVRPRRYRLYTIDEESESYDSDPPRDFQL